MLAKNLYKYIVKILLKHNVAQTLYIVIGSTLMLQGFECKNYRNIY